MERKGFPFHYVTDFELVMYDCAVFINSGNDLKCGNRWKFNAVANFTNQCDKSRVDALSSKYLYVTRDTEMKAFCLCLGFKNSVLFHVAEIRIVDIYVKFCELC